MITFHLIRPLFLLGFIGLFIFHFFIKKYRYRMHAWVNWCDKPLLDALMQHAASPASSQQTFLLLWLSISFMLVAAAGPAWKQLPVPVLSQDHPKIILFDISQNMLAADVSPNRLQRARLLIQDLLSQTGISPVGLIVYTQEPFIVSPLTEDAQTITALLPAVDADIAPIGGQTLSAALQEAYSLFRQAHFSCGSILVLTGSPPPDTAIDEASQLAEKGCQVSILPMTQQLSALSDFETFAQAGQGHVISLHQAPTSLTKWVRLAQHHAVDMKKQPTRFPRWEDEGRWFLIPALLCFIPMFQRGWLRRFL